METTPVAPTFSLTNWREGEREGGEEKDFGCSSQIPGMLATRCFISPTRDRSALSD
jgi:hypothetical protein